jgi:hypothetical protein
MEPEGSLPYSTRAYPTYPYADPDQCIPCRPIIYVGVLINLCLFLSPIFLFAPQQKEFFFDGLKKLEQRSHKRVEHRGEYVE